MRELVEIPALEGDDVGFIHAARSELGAAGTLTGEIYLVKVDHWFGPKWLQFSAKVIGAFGVARGDVTLPPFHPSRIVFERRFVRDERGTWIESAHQQKLHIQQESGDNLRRTLDKVSSSATFIWYSGDTQKTGRGSLMVYTCSGEERDAWHVEILKKGASWRAAKRTFGFGFEGSERHARPPEHRG